MLYSDQIRPTTSLLDERMLDLIGRDRPTIGYLPSSSDPERKWYRECQNYYAQCGADLNLYFGLDKTYDPAKLESLMSRDAIHLSGGNTYLFYQRLAKHDMLQPLRQFASEGGVLIGVSAGAILMTSYIATSRLCGDTAIEDVPDDAGLGLVEFAFVPHVGRFDIGTQELLQCSQALNTTVYGCSDGGGLIVDDGEIECIGGVVVAEGRDLFDGCV